MTEHVKTNDTVRFGALTHDPSGGALIAADETPKWSVFEEASDSPIQEGFFTARTGFDGTYRGNVVASAANGFDPDSFYEVHASGKVNGVVGRAIIKTFVLDDIFNSNLMQVDSGNLPAADVISDAVWDETQSTHTIVGSFGAYNQDIFYADIQYIQDATNDQDEYGITWFKNASLITSGDITNPALTVYNTSTGAKLITDQTLDYASHFGEGILRHNSTLLASGEPYMIITSGVIDSVNREWKKIVGLSLID